MYTLYKSLPGRKAPSNFIGTNGDQPQGERLKGHTNNDATLWAKGSKQLYGYLWGPTSGRKAPSNFMGTNRDERQGERLQTTCIISYHRSYHVYIYTLFIYYDIVYIILYHIYRLEHILYIGICALIYIYIYIYHVISYRMGGVRYWVAARVPWVGW